MNAAQEAPHNPRQQDQPNVQQYPPQAGGYGFSANDAGNSQKRYATPAFHTYRKQMLSNFPQNQQANYQAQSRDGAGGALLRALLDLPQVIRGAFTNPASTLQGMIRREDKYTGGIVVLLSLIFAFLAGMILTKGALGMLLSTMSGLTGLQLADSAASLNQGGGGGGGGGVGYLAGKISVSVGGVAVICQLIAALVPVIISMAYLSLLRQVRFSFVLASGFAAIVTLPILLALLLAAVCSLITPYLSLLILFFGQIVSYVLLCNLAVQLTDSDISRTVPAQASLVCLSELVKILLIAVIGGAMLSGVFQTLSGLTNSVSGLL